GRRDEGVAGAVSRNARRVFFATDSTAFPTKAFLKRLSRVQDQTYCGKHFPNATNSLSGPSSRIFRRSSDPRPFLSSLRKSNPRLRVRGNVEVDPPATVITRDSLAALLRRQLQYRPGPWPGRQGCNPRPCLDRSA